MKKTAIVSGIGCAGRVAGYMKLDSFHTTHGRAIPFATGLKWVFDARNLQRSLPRCAGGDAKSLRSDTGVAVDPLGYL